MKKALLLLLFIIQISFAFAKNETAQASITGLLKDNINQQPIAGAMVTLAALNQVALTDEKGKFSFTELPCQKLLRK
jgi:hypothetical protein